MRDKSGILEMPIQYVLAITIFFSSILILSYAFYHFWEEKEVEKAIEEADKIVGEAEEMYYAGENGSVHMHVNIPKSVKKIIFSYEQKNCYCIVMRWNRKIIRYSKAIFIPSEIYPEKEEILLKIKGGYIEISQ